MKKIWVHKTRSFKEAERFNIRFWKAQKASVRFAALWDAVKDFYKLRGMRGVKLRLRRSVQRIKLRTYKNP